ncbi:hypothetical protein GCM10011374_18840 [Kocuria dechangensis]|uniref:YtxH domain-containing protein n=1 Tax=Kocuria dechangensis TaxID=1176249 RepID=A0A917GTT3_9MICC|nr:hypothetical protein [Kocuria dechangensis]GGG56185.1 hypothetical protein GCM10011374_18840 [Kocuria dechangensis]
MIKRLIFATGFAVGFVVGSASGRKSYESLKQNALKTWHDPKVQEKVSEGTDWVKAEVPVVGEKLAGGAKKAAGTVGTKAADASSAVKEKVSGSTTDTDKGTATAGTGESDYSHLETAKPVVTDSPVNTAEPFPAPGESSN